MGVAAGGVELQEEDLPSELWAVYKKEREHREHVKEWIAGTIGFAKNSIPYCHLSKNILDITPNKGISTAQAVYISTMAMTLDPNRDRAVELVNAFLEYSSDYRETLEFLLGKNKKEKPIPTTQIERLRQDIVELVNGVKLDVAEHRANIDQLYEEVFKEEEEEQQYCRCELETLEGKIKETQDSVHELRVRTITSNGMVGELEKEFESFKTEIKQSTDLIDMSLKRIDGLTNRFNQKYKPLMAKSHDHDARLNSLERSLNMLQAKLQFWVIGNQAAFTRETTPVLLDQSPDIASD